MKALRIKNRCRIYEIPTHLDYIVAPPRMQRYIDVSASIYGIYLSYVAKEDIHVYSIDEAFLDVTAYRRSSIDKRPVDRLDESSVVYRSSYLKLGSEL